MNVTPRQKKIIAQKKFLKYVHDNHPNLFKETLRRMSKRRANNGMAGLGITVEEMIAEQNAFAEPASNGISWENIFSTFTDSLQTIIPAYVSLEQGKNCIEVNTERAKAGLAPIDCASAGLTPQAQVNVGVSKEIQLLMFGAIGLAALYMFTRKK